MGDMESLPYQEAKLKQKALEELERKKHQSQKSGNANPSSKDRE